MLLRSKYVIVVRFVLFQGLSGVGYWQLEPWRRKAKDSVVEAMLGQEVQRCESR